METKQGNEMEIKLCIRMFNLPAFYELSDKATGEILGRFPTRKAAEKAAKYIKASKGY